MREIKFRGKRVDNGEWVYGSLIRKFAKPHKVYIPFGYRIEVNHDEVYEVIPETIGQYTGLKDGKRTAQYPEGQEVYEGDIVTVLQTDEEEFIRKHDIRFLNGRWVYQQLFGNCQIESLGDFFSFEPTSCRNTALEVIGNIHEILE